MFSISKTLPHIPIHNISEKQFVSNGISFLLLVNQMASYLLRNSVLPFFCLYLEAPLVYALWPGVLCHIIRHDIFHLFLFSQMLQEINVKKPKKKAGFLARRNHLLIKKARSKHLTGQSSRMLAVKRSKVLLAMRKSLLGQISKLSAVDQGKFLEL